MKKLMLFTVLLLSAVVISAQGPLHGFFKPSDARINIQKQALSLKTEPATGQFLFSPYVSITGVAIQFGGGKPQTFALNLIGLGISYGKYSIVNEKAYCNWAVNFSLLTQVNLSGKVSTTSGEALTFGLFNKFLNFGVGYLDKHVMGLFQISTSF